MRNRILGLGLAAVLSPTMASAAAISTFTGGDPGEGLDMQGAFTYAVHVGGPAGPLPVGDAAFTDVDTTPGIAVTAVNNTAFGTPEYGATTNDNNLEQVMDFVRYGAGPGGPVVVSAVVTVGQDYKMQLLFNEACCNREFDVFLNGTLIADNFNPGITQGGTGGPAPQTVGALITETFTATDPLLIVELRGTGAPNTDPNAIFDSMTLENTTIPEPGALALGLIGLVPFLRRSRRA